MNIVSLVGGGIRLCRHNTKFNLAPTLPFISFFVLKNDFSNFYSLAFRVYPLMD